MNPGRTDHGGVQMGVNRRIHAGNPSNNAHAFITTTVEDEARVQSGAVYQRRCYADRDDHIVMYPIKPGEVKKYVSMTTYLATIIA